MNKLLQRCYVNICWICLIQFHRWLRRHTMAFGLPWVCEFVDEFVSYFVVRGWPLGLDFLANLHGEVSEAFAALFSLASLGVWGESVEVDGCVAATPLAWPRHSQSTPINRTTGSADLRRSQDLKCRYFNNNDPLKSIFKGQMSLFSLPLQDVLLSRGVQSNPVFWNILIIFGALPWPNRWFCQQRVVIWLWVDALGYNISKNQLPRSKTVASSHKKVHFWNPIWRTPSALWNGPSPISLSFLFWSRWDLVCQSTLGSSWLVPNLIEIHHELAKI